MADSDGEGNEFFDPEEEIGIGKGDKKLNLDDCTVETGEEKEDTIFITRLKIFRWRNKEWKERGTGEARLLRHKDSKRIRFVLRQDKTLKAAANFIVSESDPLCILEPHQQSDKMFIFKAYDCSEETGPQFEQFVIKLGNAEKAKIFKDAFEAARLFNKMIKEGKESEAKFADVIVEEKKDEETKEKKEDEKKEN